MALLLAVALGVTGIASAQQPPSWSLEPTNPQDGPGRNWFVLDLQPGQVLRDSVTLTNPLDQPLSFQLYAADAYNTPGDGAFTIKEPEATREDVSTWITLAADAYTVPPKQRIEIPFEIRVPENAESGDHIGGIAAKNVNPESTTTNGGVTVDIKRVVGTRVYARVAGPLLPSLRVSDVKLTTDAPLVPTGAGGGTVSYTVRNAGNVRLTPSATVTVDGPFGKKLLKVDKAPLQELLPGSSQKVIASFDELPVIGPVQARVEVSATDTSASAETSTWVIPWLLVSILLAMLVLVVWRRSRRRSSRPLVDAPVHDDHLVSQGSSR